MAESPASPRELAGAVILSSAFGSVHAFAILMAPMETMLETSRGAVSLVYSLAIASLTAGVFAAPRLMSPGPRTITLLCGLFSAIGIAAAGIIPSLPAAWLGYGLVFGFCNGVAYSLFLARAAAALPGAPGLAAGLATAAYGLGAAIAAQGLGLALERASLAAVMAALAVIIFVAAAAAAALFRRTESGFVANSPHAIAPPAFIGWLWVVYVLGASGGLMVIAHASGLMVPLGAERSAPSIVAVGNVAGSLIGGFLTGRQAQHHALAAPLAIMTAALALLQWWPAAGLVWLAAAGFAYGWLIAAVPVVIRTALGEAGFAPAFGKVFTAWGLAGLLAPTVAGLFYDRSGGYESAITAGLVAASCGLLIALLGKSLKPLHPPHSASRD